MIFLLSRSSSEGHKGYDLEETLLCPVLRWEQLLTQNWYFAQGEPPV